MLFDHIGLNVTDVASARDVLVQALRPQHRPNDHGALVIGPDGHRVEAVCHAPQA